MDPLLSFWPLSTHIEHPVQRHSHYSQRREVHLTSYLYCVKTLIRQLDVYACLWNECSPPLQKKSTSGYKKSKMNLIQFNTLLSLYKRTWFEWDWNSSIFRQTKQFNTRVKFKCKKPQLLLNIGLWMCLVPCIMKRTLHVHSLAFGHVSLTPSAQGHSASSSLGKWKTSHNSNIISLYCLKLLIYGTVHSIQHIIVLI